LKIIDIHAHTSSHPMRNLHTASASIATLEETARRYGISTIVLLATYFPLKGTGVKNHDLLERVAGNPLFLVFGSLDVMNDLSGGITELEKLAKEKKISGIKLYPGYQGFRPNDERLNGVYALADQYNLPVMFHGGELHHCCPPNKRLKGPRPCGFASCKLDNYLDLAHPRFVERPAREYPRVKFVVSHLANPHFSELRGVMTRCPNIWTDISGQFISGNPDDDKPEYREQIVYEIREFLKCPNGGKRVMFATDFPIQSYADSLELVRRLNLPEHELENIFANNAHCVLNQDHRP